MVQRTIDIPSPLLYLAVREVQITAEFPPQTIYDNVIGCHGLPPPPGPSMLLQTVTLSIQNITLCILVLKLNFNCHGLTDTIYLQIL